MKLFTLVLSFACTTAFASEPTVECIVSEKSETSSSTSKYDLSNNLTTINVSTKGRTTVLFHDADLNVVRYAEDVAKRENIINGNFFGLRRDDSNDVIVKVTSGIIKDGTASVSDSEVWNFGPTEMSIGMTEQLGSISCTRKLSRKCAHGTKVQFFWEGPTTQTTESCWNNSIRAERGYGCVVASNGNYPGNLVRGSCSGGY